MEIGDLQNQVNVLKIELSGRLKNCPIAVVEDVEIEREWLIRAMQLVVPEGTFLGFSTATGLLTSGVDFGAVVIDGDLNSGQHGPDYVEKIRKKFPKAVIIARTGNHRLLAEFEEVGVDLALLKAKDANPFDEISGMLRVAADKR